METIPRARQHTRQQSRLQHQTVVAYLAQRALAGLRPTELLTEAVERLAETIQVEYVQGLELLPDRSRFLLRAGFGCPPGLVGHATVGATPETVAGYTLAANAPVVIADLRTAPRFRSAALHEKCGVVSGLSVLIAGSSGPWGVLAMYSTRPRRFRADEVALVQHVAALLGTAFARQQREDALRASESRLRLALDAAQMGTWEWSSLTGHSTWSPQVDQMLGLPPGTLGASELALFKHLHPDDRDRFTHVTAQAIREQADYHLEFRVICPDGRLRWLATWGQVFRPEGSDEVRLVGVCQHITERKQAEAAQQFLAEASQVLASSLDYRLTLKNVAQLAVPFLADWCMVDILDEDGQIRRVEMVWADDEPPERVALLRRLKQRYQPARDSPHLVSRVLRSGQPLLITEATDDWLERTTYDAAHREVLRGLQVSGGIAVPLVARGRTLGAITLVASGTRRYGPAELALAETLAERCALAVDNARLYEQAQAAETRYRSLLEGVADAIIVADAQGRIIDANAVSCELLGYRREELLQLSLSDLGTASADQDAQELARLLDVGHWRGEIIWRRKDGSLLPVEGHVRAVELATGTVYLGSIRDISQRRALQQMQQEFMAMISHDLRNPLTSVKGYAQMMQRRQSYNEEAVEIILTQTRQLERLVGDLLDATQIEAGRLELQPTPGDLVELVRSHVEQAQALTTAHTLYLVAPEHPLPGWFDHDRLGQVLQNLLSNAIKYSPEGGAIGVRVEDLGRAARVSVADEGEGIPEEALPRLFERFYRAANAASRAKGLGLGLYISRSLIEAHGGRIWAESRPGQGSTFTFVLPYGQPPSGTV